MLKKRKKITKHNIKEDKLITTFNNTLAFVDEYKSKIMLYGGITLVAAFLIIFFVNRNIQQNQKAGLELSRMIGIYDNGSYLEAINGKLGTNFLGFKKIVEEYGSTENGEIAKIYLANSYSLLGKYEDAYKIFKDYSGSINMYKAASLAGQADYFVANKDYEEAAELYNNASLVSELNALNSEYLLKAGINYLKIGNKAKAKELFNLIKVNYKTSGVANQVDKYLAQAE
ncbi:MAG: hypothetical protein CO128_10400 [Ignavibacteriales bacterium CG_4_9_14_3_um_filter_30_11]|nr:MAG: hypothetical protein CO128_10400 [Ignavibacteriales bacterium CG_4_9_14_3_um_filter_30_11]